MEAGRASLELAVLHQAEGWLAVDKPWGRLVIPGRATLEVLSIRAQLEKQLNRRIWVVHRLDRDTSGVLLFALNKVAHRSLSMAFEAGQIAKVYLALVAGEMDAPHSVDAELVPARRGRMRVAKPGERGKSAFTQIDSIETFRGATLVEVRPQTGRTHQIRVHLRHLGFPLLVDPLYGKPGPLLDETGNVLLDRTPLHASRISVPALEGAAAAQVESSLPQDMTRLLKAFYRVRNEST
jgi:RluA family pseudouridine synthase